MRRASSDRIASCSHTAFAPTATACRAISAASPEGRNTSTMSILSGTSLSDLYTRSPNSSSANGLIGMIRKPRCCRPAGTDPPALFGSRDAPTTAMVIAPSRISRLVLLISVTKPAARRHIPCLHPNQRLARRVPPQLLAREPIRARLPAGDGACDVGSDENVWSAPQRMLFRQRFRIGHVERSANVARPQGLHQSLGVDSPAPTRIHEQRAPLHLAEEFPVDELFRLRRAGQKVDHDVRLGQKPGQSVR